MWISHIQVQPLPLQVNDDRLERRESLHEIGEGTVKQQLTVVNDDDALAQRFHVRHVVTGEQHRSTNALVVLGDESANAPLHGHIQAQRWFVEKQNLRSMQQGHGNFAFHTLTEGQIAHGLA